MRRRKSLYLFLVKVATVLFVVFCLWPVLDRKLTSQDDFVNLCQTPIAPIFHSRIQWNEYRIGDGISLQYEAPGCEKYPGSIVCLYSQETSQPNDIDALSRALEKNPRPATGEEIAYLHARLGDGLCAQHDPPCRGARNSVPDCWNNNDDCFMNRNSMTKQYAYSKHWYDNVIIDLLATKVSKIIIIGDKFHWTRTPDPRGGNFSVDEEYLSKISRFFHDHGFAVCVKAPELPDDDFALLSSANVFTQGGGGYSALVAKMVTKSGGLVLQPSSTSLGFRKLV